MGRPTARTDDLTAQRYLAAGWELCQAKLGYGKAPARKRSGDDDLKDFPLLGTIGPSDVVGPGETTGGFYRRWSSKGRYLADLARYIVSQGRLAGHDAEQRAKALVMRLGDVTTLGAMIQAAAQSDIEELTTDPTFAFQLQMWSIRRRYAWAADALRASYGAANEEWADAYELIFRLYGLRLRPGYDGHRLAVVVNALVDGLTLRRGFDPDAVDDDLFPELLVALFHGLLEHDDDTTPTGVVEAFDRFVSSGPRPRA